MVHSTRVTNLAGGVALIASLLSIAALLSGCHSIKPTASGDSNADGLIISAAVSLKDAFKEIAELQASRTGTRVHFNFGASGALQKQIEAGAPADIFASAGAKQMDDLEAKGLIAPSTRKDFARNVLVLIIPPNAAGISSLTDLTRPEVKQVAVGNPKTVPAGRYTEQTFNRLNLLPQIQPKLIYAEDVRQVLDYVVRGEVDAGIVYATDAVSAGAKVKVAARAADESHDPILYPIAVVKESHQQAAAQRFIDLLLSSEGQSILAKHGFIAIK